MILFLYSFISFAKEYPITIDSFKTSSGELQITFLGHASLLFQFKNKNIFIDPYSALVDYSKLPKADLIFITHEHPDHMDMKAIEAIKTKQTKFILNQKSFEFLKDGQIMKNGDIKEIDGINVEAIPAYNLIHKRPTGELFHPKGQGNGYLFIFGDKKIYVAGDTENIPEMKILKKIDIAFLPMNLPYTMTPEMVADATKAFKPKMLYPYHTGETDIKILENLLKNEKEIEVRVRNMK